ncbi:hypothetical protein ACJX0J_007086 [Zea mays]
MIFRLSSILLLYELLTLLDIPQNKIVVQYIGLYKREITKDLLFFSSHTFKLYVQDSIDMGVISNIKSMLWTFKGEFLNMAHKGGKNSKPMVRMQSEGLWHILFNEAATKAKATQNSRIRNSIDLGIQHEKASVNNMVEQIIISK